MGQGGAGIKAAPVRLFLLSAAASSVPVVLNILAPRFAWVHEPAHASVEAFGAVVAVFMAFMLLHRQRGDDAARLFWVAAGLLGMGLLHGFHAVARPGHGLVLLFTAGSLAGGIFFAMTWLPEPARSSPARKRLPWAVAAGSVLLGFWSLHFRETLPLMMRAGQFTWTARLGNVLAGLLFMAAAIRFLLDHRRSGLMEHFLFSCLAVLFGLSNLFFPFSSTWDNVWWSWHLLRLLASLLLLWFLFDSEQRAVSALKSAVEERCTAEEAIRVTRDYLENLLHYANAPIIVWDPSFRITRFNRAFERLSGYTAGEAIGKDLTLLFPEDGLQKSMEKIERTLGGEHWESVEIPIRRKDGEIRIVLWNSANISAGDTSQLAATIAQGMDITERKQAEEALRESEGKYRTLIEHSNDLIWTLDKEGRFTFVNGRAEEVGGYRLEELLGRSFGPLLPPKDLPRVSRLFAEVLGGAPRQYEVDFYGKDGSLCALSVNSTPLVKSGEVVGTVSFGADVTESRRAEAFKNDILESVDEGVIVVDQHYRIMSSNRAYAEMTNRRCEDVAGMRCYQASHRRDRPCFEEGEDCPVRRTFETGSSHTVQHVHYDAGGNPLFIEIKSFPMKDREGRVHAVIEISREITERVRIEEQLRHAQKIEGIGQLAGGVAHDFNNVLAAIVGFAGILQMKLPKGDPLRRYADEIVATGERGADLTRQILAFSRKQVFDLKPVRLNGIVRGVEQMLCRLLPEGVDIALDLTGEDPAALVDAGQIGQVLINLVTNARDAIAGSGRIRIATGRFAMDRDFIETHGYGEPGEYAVLTVADTGRGMDAASRARVFEPFFTTKEIGKGTGLGLAVVHGIVKQHRGYIDVGSEVGKGTEIRVYLPLAVGAVGAEPPAGPPTGASDGTSTGTAGGNETILVAEDDPVLRQLSRTLLDQYGYTVIEAEDGVDAVAKFAGNRDAIRLVILDGLMPKLGGIEALAQIRRLSPGVKAIFMSGYAEDLFSGGALQDPAAAFVQKPLMPADLLRTVREVLDR